MNERSKPLAVLAAIFAVASCTQNTGSTATPAVSSARFNATAPSARERKLWGPGVFAACPPTSPGVARCMALLRVGSALRSDGGSGPLGGFTPAQIRAAYNLGDASEGHNELVAIVDAYDNPNVASDLGAFRSYFGLPAAKFTKYNQDGQIGNYPQGDVGWGAEEDLDVQMVSISCPRCAIALIEANTARAADLQAAVAEAESLSARIISNSYGCYTPCGFDSGSYDAPGVLYVAASGDAGYGFGMATPAAFDAVVSSGGTSLYVSRKNKRGFEETAWLGTNSGCSTEPKPAWQTDPSCAGRMGA